MKESKLEEEREEAMSEMDKPVLNTMNVKKSKIKAKFNHL